MIRKHLLRVRTRLPLYALLLIGVSLMVVNEVADQGPVIGSLLSSVSAALVVAALAAVLIEFYLSSIVMRSAEDTLKRIERLRSYPSFFKGRDAYTEPTWVSIIENTHRQLDLAGRFPSKDKTGQIIRLLLDKASNDQVKIRWLLVIDWMDFSLAFPGESQNSIARHGYGAIDALFKLKAEVDTKENCRFEFRLCRSPLYYHYCRGDTRSLIAPHTYRSPHPGYFFFELHGHHEHVFNMYDRDFETVWSDSVEVSGDPGMLYLQSVFDVPVLPAHTIRSPVTALDCRMFVEDSEDGPAEEIQSAVNTLAASLGFSE